MSSTLTNTNEGHFLDALRRREPSAFRRLVEEYGPRLRSVILRYVRNDADADDALQDAFVSAARGIDRFQGDSSLSTWLHSIAARAALMKLRSRKRHLDETGIDALLPQYNIVGHRVLPTAPAAAADELQSKETRELVRRQIERLPEMYRVVLMARDIEELTTQEASDALGLNEAALKTRLHRARAALRTLLEPYIRRNSI